MLEDLAVSVFQEQIWIFGREKFSIAAEAKVSM